MLDDMLDIILEEKFPRSEPKENRKNGFRLLYSDLFNPKTKKVEVINLRRPFKISLYPFPNLNPMINNPDFLKEKKVQGARRKLLQLLN